MMTDLELYLYSDRYGPTNEKLAVYLRDLYAPAAPHRRASRPGRRSIRVV